MRLIVVKCCKFRGKTAKVTTFLYPGDRPRNRASASNTVQRLRFLLTSQSQFRNGLLSF